MLGVGKRIKEIILFYTISHRFGLAELIREEGNP